MPPTRTNPADNATTIFVDREEPRSTFNVAVHSIPSNSCSLRTWYGIGGQGKTALARKLFRISEPGVTSGYPTLRRAMLDLHGRDLTDPDQLILRIRNEFSKAGIAFPAFDLAFAIMWQKTRGEQALPPIDGNMLNRAGETFSEFSGDTATLILEIFGETVQTIPVLGHFIKKAAQWVFDKSKQELIKGRRKYLRDFFFSGGAPVADYEMSERLPWLLAQELNKHLEKNPTERFVLFVDEYERVREGAGTGAKWQGNKFDKCLQDFITETNGLLALIFSRERLHWEDIPGWTEDLRGNQHLLGGLSDHDAEQWLIEAKVTEKEHRDAIICGARETLEDNAPVYPLLLDLQVEHWRKLGDKARPEEFVVKASGFEARRNELIQRLLRDYGKNFQDLIERLSVVRHFDNKASKHVAAAFGISLSQEDFEDLSRLSIVSMDEKGWLSIHSAVADAIFYSMSPSKVSDSRNELLKHFSERAKPVNVRDVNEITLACLAEAARLRRAQGAKGYVDWLSEMGERVREARFDRFLIVLWQEALDTVLAAFDANHTDIALAKNNLALALDYQGRHNEAIDLYKNSLKILKEQDGAAVNGLLLKRQIEDVYTNLGTSYSATGGYENANYFFNKASKYQNSPKYESKEESLRRSVLDSGRANNLMDQGSYAEAERLFRRVLDIRRKYLPKIHPDVARAENNLAQAITYQGRFDEAEPRFRLALEIWKQELPSDHPDLAAVYNNFGLFLNEQKRHVQAEDLYRKALDVGLRTYSEGHEHIATFRHNLGQSLSAQQKYEEARVSFHVALQIRMKKYGRKNRDTRCTFGELETILENQAIDHTDRQEYLAAEPLWRNLLDINLKMHGNGSVPTAKAYANLAICLFRLERHIDSDPLFRKVLEIYRAIDDEGQVSQYEISVIEYYYSRNLKKVEAEVGGA